MKLIPYVLSGVLLGTAIGVGASPLYAQGQPTTRTADASGIEQQIGPVRVYGSGDLSEDAQELSLGVEARDLLKNPLFFLAEGRISQERLLPYDLRQWGAKGGVGWALGLEDDLVATYRFDHYNDFNVGKDVDTAFRSVAGQSAVTALGLSFVHDGRDDRFYPTLGRKFRLSGEMASKWLGGDYNFGRIESGISFYSTPFRDGSRGAFLEQLTFVEHLRVGWVESFGSTDDVPFFERYFVGGASTVRGSRGRWLSPRGSDNQFVGGTVEIINNIEARMPIFKQTFHNRLSAATFFDVGRAFRRFSGVGDFGYGIGAGLRYIARIWKIEEVIRVDYGFNLDPKEDNSISRLHITVGLPF